MQPCVKVRLTLKSDMGSAFEIVTPPLTADAAAELVRVYPAAEPTERSEGVREVLLDD